MANKNDMNGINIIEHKANDRLTTYQSKNAFKGKKKKKIQQK